MAKRCCYFLSLLPSLECLTSVFSVCLLSKPTWYIYLHVFKSTRQRSVLTLTKLSMSFDWVHLSFLKHFLFLAMGHEFSQCLGGHLFLAYFVVTCLYRCLNFGVPRAETFTHTISISHWVLNLVAHQSVNLKNETIGYWVYLGISAWDLWTMVNHRQCWREFSIYWAPGETGEAWTGVHWWGRRARGCDLSYWQQVEDSCCCWGKQGRNLSSFCWLCKLWWVVVHGNSPFMASQHHFECFHKRFKNSPIPCSPYRDLDSVVWWVGGGHQYFFFESSPSELNVFQV